MTVSVTNQKVTANGNDSATVFSFSPITIFVTSEVVVTHVDSIGTETTLSEGTGASAYSVSITSPSSLPSVGSVKYPEDEVTPLPTGESIVIKRVVPLTQLTDLENQGGYFPDTQEQVYDRGTMVDLQQQEEIDRAMALPISVTGVSSELPIPVGDRLLGWNTAADAIVNNASSGTLADPVPIANGGTSATTASGARTALGIYAASRAGFRNIIINGGFQVNQRVYVSTTATADGVYMHDRWRSGSTDSSYTFSVAAPNSPQSVTIAANDSIEQVIEGVSITTAGTHTISWTGTATCRAVVNTQTMSGNFAVSPITVTAVLDQVITMQFTGADAAGGATEATDTGTLGKVQCELGSIATAFESRPIGVELVLCQRYYTKTFPQETTPAQNVGAFDGCIGDHASATAAFTLFGLWEFPVVMRAEPTVVTYNPHAADANWRDAADSATKTVGTVQGNSDRRFTTSTSDTVIVSTGYFIHATADAEL